MEGIRDLWNYFKEKQSTSKLLLAAKGENDASQAEFAIVEKEIEKGIKPRV